VQALRELGHDVYDRGVQKDADLVNPGAKGSYLVVLGPETDRIARPSQMPAILSETIFLTHREEGALVQDPAALDRLAMAYATAIVAYFEEAE
jgi:hypothetical protein